MAPAERKALLFLSAVALLGAGYRLVRAGDRPAPDAASQRALASHMAAVDSAKRADSAKKAERKMAGKGKRTRKPQAAPDSAGSRQPAARLDLDRATAAELEALPGIGPSLASRIIASRDSLGPFGSLDGLERVRGVGTALRARLRDRVTFSGVPRSASSGASTSSAIPAGSAKRARRRP